MTSRRTWGIVAIVAAGMLLAGCSWRLETPPPDWPSPDPITVMRDAAAEREQAVIDAIAGSAGAGTPQTVVLEEIEGMDAPLRLEALGGLYVAYPDATPSAEATAQAVPTKVSDAVSSARDGHLTDAQATQDADLARLLGSAGLSHALSSWYALWVEDRIADASLPVVAERTLASPALADQTVLPVEASAIDPSTLGDLALAHDQARYAYEVMAARAGGDEREQWLDRRDLQDARAAALVASAGVEDRREAVYVLTPEQVTDGAQRLATAIEIEDALGASYANLAAGAEPADLAWLLCAAFDAYAQAAAFAEPGAESYTVPALPGLEAEAAE